ncbi:MAG: Ig-like domain-containing protein [Minisyncoccia bacterium]
MDGYFRKLLEKNKEINLPISFLATLVVVVYIFAQILTTGSIFAESTSTPLFTGTATQNSTSSGTSDPETGGSGFLVPQPPTGFSGIPGTCGTGKIYLYWQNSSGTTNYVVYRNNAQLVYEGPNLSSLDSGLTADTNYIYSISARNVYGASSITSVNIRSPKACDVATATTTVGTSLTNTTVVIPTGTNATTSETGVNPNIGGIPPRPTAIYSNLGSCGTGKIYLHWQNSSGATGYRLYVNDVNIYDGPNSYFQDTRPLNNTTYMYRVVAYNSYGGGEGTTLSVKFPGVCPPDVNTNTTSVGTPPKPAENTTALPIPTNATFAQTPSTTTQKTEVVKTSDSTTVLKPDETELLHPVETTPSSKPFALETANQIQNFSSIIETTKIAVDSAKEEIEKVINTRISNITKTLSPAQILEASDEIELHKNKLLEEINLKLVGLTDLTPEKISEIKGRVENGLKEIDLIIHKENTTQIPLSAVETNTVNQVLNTLSVKVLDGTKALKAQGGDLLYKDSNNDGISDYESKHVYNIDPLKPSPTTVYEGKQITAGEKVLLGFDPGKTELVRVTPEEPNVSDVPVTSSYKVNNVELSKENKVVLKGTALPNSYVTLYIYSTPIIVTVKTNSDGEWEYTIDKELNSGEHTVYTATVNNTGKILAKSPGFSFVKTAEAATLSTITPTQSGQVEKPGLLNTTYIIIIVTIFLLTLGVAFIIVGINSKKETSI